MAWWRTGSSWRHGLWGGVIAGFIAGVGLRLLFLIVDLAQGNDLWQGMKFAAAPFLGLRAMQPGPDAGAVALGLLCHFAVSIGWGAGFGALAHGLARVPTVLFGLLWGVVVWLGMYYVVMPAAGM